MRTTPLLLTSVLTAAALAALPSAAQAKAPAKAGDFNGDGKTDLVLGGPSLVKRGLVGPGLVAVLYGKTGRKQVITRDTKAVAAVAEHGDGFGGSTASADFDRDGYADLAVTGPEEDGVTLIYGSKKGLSGRVAFLKTAASSPSWVPALATGDLDRDGYPDLVATVANRYWVFAKVNKGKKQDGAAGELAEQDGTKPARLLPVISDFTGDGRPDLVLGATSNGTTRLLKNSPDGLTDPVAVPGLNVAPTLVAGDLDGDGNSDLVAGGWGRVLIYPGRPGGFAKPKSFTSRTAGVPVSGDGHSFGTALAIGDVNRDGRADLVVGAPYAGVKNSGQVVLLYGHKTGVTTKGALLFSQKTKAFKASSERGDDFGMAVRLLDLSGDKGAELVIGSPGEDKDTGRLYVLASKKGKPTASGARQYRPKDFGLGGIRFGSHLLP